MRRLIGALVVGLALEARAGEQPEPSSAQAETLTYTDENKILLGTPGRELSPRELFQVLGRTDLLERSESALVRRRVLLISAAGVLVAGVAVGAYFLATTPDLATGACNIARHDTADYFNDVCVPQNRMHQALGGGFLVGGVAVAAVLAGMGLAMSPDVLNHWELQKLIEERNASKAASLTFRFAPMLGPNLVGAVAAARF